MGSMLLMGYLYNSCGIPGIGVPVVCKLILSFNICVYVITCHIGGICIVEDNGSQPRLTTPFQDLKGKCCF